jgi:hypothetical protein
MSNSSRLLGLENLGSERALSRRFVVSPILCSRPLIISAEDCWPLEGFDLFIELGSLADDDVRRVVKAL